MRIYLKGCYRLNEKIASNEPLRPFVFQVPHCVDQSIRVTIIPGQSSAEADMSVDIPNDLFKFIESGDLSRPSEKNKDTLRKLNEPLDKATKKIINLIKYSLRSIKLDDSQIEVVGRYWSKDIENWASLPNLTSSPIELFPPIKLDDRTASSIQTYLRKNYEPFVALRHLQAAMSETNPRFKWIDATIAAEIAIKEFLIKKHPSIRTLLLEMPAPPPVKLYGPILKELGGEESPRRAKIKDGVEIRNKLVHSPVEIEIDPIKADEYVNDIQVAIYHLLQMLYPGDPLINELYKP